MTNPLVALVQPPRAVPHSTYRWGTVDDVDPYTVLLDGDSTPVSVGKPLGRSPRVGDRVWCQLYNRQCVVLGVAGGGGGEEFVATSKSAPSTFSAIADVVWNAAATNEGNLWVRDGTNTLWTCQQEGVYSIKFLYATTGLTSGATRAILDVIWAGGGTTEARIVLPYNTLTQTQSTSMTVAMGPGDTVRARVQATMTVTLSEVNLYIVRH